MSFRGFVGAARRAAAAAPPRTAARAEPKIAYVDLQRALQEVDEGRTAQARLEPCSDNKQKDLDKEQEGLQKEKELRQAGLAP